MMNLTCNSTLEELRILPATEIAIAGTLTFHQLALIIGAATAGIAILLSLYLIMMHALNYTVPHEQKHIMRILFMVPIYAASSYLSIRFYWHAIYFQVICDCYEAFAISSFFSLMCHYIKPTLHEQKEYFRDLHPITPWVWPLTWFAKCCGGKRGPWRTPQSGLTWFNIIWIGIYHYCFIRIAMTITAVVTQYFHRYCESSNSPVFSHIWIVVIQSVAVTIAMYCVIQFYVQLRHTEQLAPNQPFLKVLAIKLVIFLSFWQSMAISVGTSTLNIVHANEVLAYPDIKVGIPSLLLCIEMAAFAVLHLWAFPYAGYRRRAISGAMPKQGGFLGALALWDTVNVWDVAKGFGRGMRWLFVGVRNRRQDVSYTTAPRKNSSASVDNDGTGDSALDMDDLGRRGRVPGMSSHKAAHSTAHLPIANEFRASRFGNPALDPSGAASLSPSAAAGAAADQYGRRPSPLRSGGENGEERAGLIQNAQQIGASPGMPHHDPYGESAHGYDGGAGGFAPASPPDDYVVVDVPAQQQGYYEQPHPGERRHSLSTVDEESFNWSRGGSRQDMAPGAGSNPNRNSTQMKVGEALWGPRDPMPPPSR
ncbi:putative DUF300 domain protein [Podospora appendiculata]|uniref:DUF300 domain protein n=1 Tax=Podospora appendiculata TaxID=314037 RepID=A0AAE1CBE4_9PEZI|nr:putative DUF300 domain protein [Podospora appendiculata]